MDELDFLELLPTSKYASKQDRYNSFRKLFMGTGEGKQVLYEILSWGRFFDIGISGSPIDQVAMNISAGEKNMAIRLLHVVNTEPPDLPKQTTRKRIK